MRAGAVAQAVMHRVHPERVPRLVPCRHDFEAGVLERPADALTQGPALMGAQAVQRLALKMSLLKKHYLDRLGLDKIPGVPPELTHSVRDWILFVWPEIKLQIFNPWPSIIGN